MRLERTEGAWAEAIAHHGDTKRCPRCGRTLPSRESFRLRRMPEGWRLTTYCKQCQNKVHNEFRARKREQEGKAQRGLTAHEMFRRPIPALEVGRQYCIVDRSWTINGFADEDSKPMIATFVGRCVAKYGRNWAILTGTGIRCFTSGQLVGLQVRELTEADRYLVHIPVRVREVA